MAAAIVAIGVAAGAGMKAHAAAAADATPLAPGTAAPNFSLPSQEEKPVSLKDYKGKFVVLYFYPKDMTSGCTMEAHNFQRDLPKYDALNAVVLGVSLDTVESHKTFCSKDSLTFKLLADPDHKVIDAYGVPVSTRTTPDGKSMSFAKRDTFLISPDGKVIKTWEVKDIASHSDEILAAITAAKK
ncbi:peroxiredoxin [Granulicella rosea]|nr:peroxiredoxin [Granulicella rosea]